MIDPAGDPEQVKAAVEVLTGAGLPVGPVADWRLRQMAGGWSRHTFLLEGPVGDRPRRFVVRAQVPGGILDTDLRLEYGVYRELAGTGVRVPPAHGLDDRDRTPFGGPFFVMDFEAGEAPVVWRARDRESLEHNWATTRSLAHDLVGNLAAIHVLPAERFAFLGAPMSFTQVVERWQEVYRRHALVRDPVIEEAFAWASSRAPADPAVALVHGDYRIGNTLVADDQIRAVIDWELCYVGDPRFDLGYASLQYVAGKFLEPVSEMVCAVAGRDWFFERYGELIGAPVDLEVVRTFSVIGALMLIAILHTGIRQYADGKTDDVRMVWNRFAIPGLRQDVIQLMGWS